MRETWVRSLFWEDLACQGATKLKDRFWAWVAKLLKHACLELVLHNKRSHRDEKPCTLQAESSPHLSQIEKWPYRKYTQYSQKKEKPKSLAFVSVGTKAPLEGDERFIHQRTEQEVEEKKNLLWEFINTKYLFSHRTLALQEFPKHDELCGFLSVLVTADLGSQCWSFPTHLIFCY